MPCFIQNVRCALSSPSVDFIQPARYVYPMQRSYTLVYCFHSVICILEWNYTQLSGGHVSSTKGGAAGIPLRNIFSFVFDNFVATFADVVKVVLVIWKFSDECYLWQENKREYWQAKLWYTWTSFNRPKVSIILNINVGDNVFRVLCDALNKQFITKSSQHIEHD